MQTVKRIHLSDCALNSEQLIALAEIIPEMKSIAHVSFLQNPELTKLADARTEETQEEASALYASLLAATRISPSLVCVDIDVPTENTGEIVKALAKQIVAYCLRNMGRLPLRDGGDTLHEALLHDVKDPQYPDVLQHLVGHDVLHFDDTDEEDLAPDDDYIVGGTGVAKALACCLNNRGDASRRNSGEFVREFETGVTLPKSKMPARRAKDVSKHLLLSARKIRHRLEPALSKARLLADRGTYYRLLFLQKTLDGIIKRFEDEFPETKEESDSAVSVSPPDTQLDKTPTCNSLSSGEVDPEHVAGGSDGDPDEDMDMDLRPGLPRTSSNVSLTSQALDREEGWALRSGHKFRSGWMTSEQYQLLSSAGLEALEKDAHQLAILNDLIDELDNEEIKRLREEKGVVRLFHENRHMIVDACREADPEYWSRFVESQEKAKANVKVANPKCDGSQLAASDEEAITD